LLATAIHSPIDRLTTAIHAPVDTIALAVEAFGGDIAPGCLGTSAGAIQASIGGVTAPVETAFDAVTTIVETLLDSIASRVESLGTRVVIGKGLAACRSDREGSDQNSVPHGRLLGFVQFSRTTTLGSHDGLTRTRTKLRYAK